MKKVLSLLLLVGATSSFAQATGDTVTNTGARADLQTLPVQRNQLGTGTPAPMITVGTETAVYVDDGYYHIPQYLPNYPTAGVIWPRVVEVQCEKINDRIVCEGYNWAPKLGRGEYIMIIPRLKAEQPVPRNVVVQAPPPVIIYREVPRKRKAE